MNLFDNNWLIVDVNNIVFSFKLESKNAVVVDYTISNCISIALWKSINTLFSYWHPIIACMLYNRIILIDI